MVKNSYKTSFSLGEKVGAVALLLAFLLFFVSPALAILPLVVFLILCLGAPFFPGLSFFLPVISRGKNESRKVAVTFDDGPSPESTPVLLDLLERHNLQATFFVVGEKAVQYPDLIQSILDKGHTLGNHSRNHDSFLMLRSHKRLCYDIYSTQEILKNFGVKPLVFRPPVGITGSRLKKVLAEIGLVTVNFSCRAYDRGNRNINNLAGKILSNLHPGDVIMLHDLPPSRKDMMAYWQEELDILFEALQTGYTVVPLEQLIERPVMQFL
ncbi:polysaccharide deacetylase family protein [Desulforhopalus sp. IMCC35007]|uniref:polysaccharide deacetylase family protein n=1 Tax=Desulforhopalus sp. IMCC35007 TaxID=2569543 RepID=UPI0010AECCA5|nr:polysaccharide deacetylase family protein [Desulforhopalus sp. IMCC35007]TKB10805.1 polysaccharide deacetylase family protein [Desulforhopalus sp. IMCC35007]